MFGFYQVSEGNDHNQFVLIKKVHFSLLLLFWLLWLSNTVNGLAARLMVVRCEVKIYVGKLMKQGHLLRTHKEEEKQT